MTIETQSGSIYMFSTKNGRMFLWKGSHEYLVQALSFEIGKPLEIDAFQLSLYTYKPSEELTHLRSTPVIAIKI